MDVLLLPGREGGRERERVAIFLEHISARASDRPPKGSEHQLLWYLLDPLCSSPSISSATKTRDSGGGGDPDDHEPADEGNI